MQKTLQNKLKRLQQILIKMDSVLVAYSGGVDSSLLLKVAGSVLPGNVLAVTAKSPTYPDDEINQAKKIAKGLRVKHLIIKTNEFKDPNFLKNPTNRCYFCKKELFDKLTRIAKKNRINFVADGSNLDDDKDYRPGSQAIEELRVRSPLKEAKLTKGDIRNISRHLRLSTWDKPAFACLASRFPYRQRINRKNLGKVQQAEKVLKNIGIKQVRVRHHNSIARIEVLEAQIPAIVRQRKKIVERLKKIGYKYICIDLQGYRTGSLNETLKLKS